jgi:hypothetical protein
MAEERFRWRSLLLMKKKNNVGLALSSFVSYSGLLFEMNDLEEGDEQCSWRFLW